MPKIRTTRTKQPPEGYEDIEQVSWESLLEQEPWRSPRCRSSRLALVLSAVVLPFRLSPPCHQILDDYAKKMRDAENESHEGKRKSESLWPIMRISHTRSRYIYELYYKREAISKELYDWLLKEGYADAKYVLTRAVILPPFLNDFDYDSLIAKWKKAGYEKLCCVRCIQTKVCGA